MKILNSFPFRPLRAGRLLTLIGVTAWTCFTGTLQAAISVTSTGAGPLTFDTTPLATDFATGVLTGNATTFFDVATMDAGVAGVSAASVVRELPTSSTEPPSAFSGGFRRHTVRNALMSRPTTDGTNAAGIMVATLQNNSGGNRPQIVISYDFALQSAATGQLPGYNVYYSLTGEPGSWLAIPELTGSETPGLVSGTLNLGTWAPGSLLYILWADDNADAITDPSYTIDNFQVRFAIDPPVITQQPVNVTGLEGRTFSLSVVATGLGLQYQWSKVGTGAIDPTANSTATQATLVITNAAVSDTGDYFVVVANGTASVTSQNAHLQVQRDEAAPVFLSASVLPTSQTIRLVLDELLCLTCGDPVSSFNWSITKANDPGFVVELSSITATGTNIDFGLTFPAEQGVAYRITMIAGDGGIEDLFGNGVPADTFIDTLPTANFRQNVNGYTGTMDTELRGAAPDSPQGAAVGAIVDADDGGGISQGLIRFDGLVGNNPGQIPFGANIVSATLTLHSSAASADGSPVNIYRMLQDWDPATATYNSFVGGVSADGVEAASQIDATIITQPGPTANFDANVNVTASVQAWANGLANHGWALISTGTDGYRWDTSESGTPPLLSVVFRVVPCASISITQQPTAPASAQEGAGFTLSVGISSPGCPPAFQWTKDGADIPGANDSSYTVQNAVPGTSVYRVRVSNSFPSTATSDPVTVTVLPDLVHPRVTRVVSSNSTTLSVTFSKVLSTASAQSLANYSILGSPAVTVTGAALAANGTTVTLTTSPRAFPADYTLRVQGVTDNRSSANVVDPNPTLVSLTSASVIHGWNSEWLFSTNSQDATLSGTPWYAPAFVPGADWSTGNGLFGFEDTAATVALLPSPIATPLPPNNIAATPDLLVTAYFRKAINLPVLPAGARYVMCAVIDDGAVFYLDGQPILTNNMLNLPPITFTNRATGAAAEGLVQVFPLNASAGSHTLAVEVHQTGTTSSDVVFGLDIRMISATGPALTITSGASTNTVSWSADSSWELSGSANVTGPYAVEAGAATSPLRFAVPATSTNHFYRLQYNGRP